MEITGDPPRPFRRDLVARDAAIAVEVRVETQSRVARERVLDALEGFTHGGEPWPADAGAFEPVDRVSS